MTVMTKPSLSYFTGKSYQPRRDTCHILNVQENETNENEEREDLEAEIESDPKSARTLTVTFVVAIGMMVALAGLMCSLEIYRHSQQATMSMLQYQGYCHIPLRQREQLIEPNYRMLPLDWHAIEAEAQVFDPTETAAATAEDSEEEDRLIEELSISDQLERITVYNGPNNRPTSFIHDFAANTSGIVDSDRCFVMNLNPDQVMTPQTLVLNIQGNEAFDLTHFRNAMQALLPPILDMMRMSRLLAEQCADKPTYQLSTDDSIIRKRSTDPVKVDYKYFSGKQIQEIEIGNLNDLIAYEKANK